VCTALAMSSFGRGCVKTPAELSYPEAGYCKESDVEIY